MRNILIDLGFASSSSSIDIKLLNELAVTIMHPDVNPSE
jgi:hypothetical protein